MKGEGERVMGGKRKEGRKGFVREVRRKVKERTGRGAGRKY